MEWSNRNKHGILSLNISLSVNRTASIMSWNNVIQNNCGTPTEG